MNRVLCRRIVLEYRERTGSQEGLGESALVELFVQVVMETASQAAGVPVKDWGARAELLLPLPVECAAFMPLTRRLLAEIPREDWTAYPELAGWLYQYLLDARKDELFAGFKQGRKAGPGDIPTVTQLFTPRWIARYMAENTIGRLWLELHPESPLKEKWQYYDREAALVDNGSLQISGTGGSEAGAREPANWRILDPACGCGHLLTAGFAVLLDIHREAGVPGTEAVRLILQHNLAGLDLDPVALRLCAFTLLLAAASVDSRIITEKLPADITVCSERADDEAGSLRRPAPGEGGCRGEELLSQRYDAVITNPPYLGRRHMSECLAGFLDREYPQTRNDLFAAFLERGMELVRPGGYHGAINQQSWMFLTGYEGLRTQLLERTTLVSLLHLGSRCFEDIGGEVVQSVCFVIRNLPPDQATEGVYWRLDQVATPAAKEYCYLQRSSSRINRVRQAEFMALPGKRLAYELPAAWRRLFHEAPPLSRFYAVKKGMDTGCNEQYVRLWHEVPERAAGIGEGPPQSGARWFPYAKGGGPRRWYGNHYYVVLWHKEGEAIRRNPKSNLRNTAYYGRPGITWSTVSTGTPGFRLLEPGFLFDNGGSCMFSMNARRTNHYALLAYLNSAVAAELLRQMNPTLNVQPGDVARLPIDEALLDDASLAALGEACVELARADWDETERSWHHLGHPVAVAGLNGHPSPSESVSLEDRFALYRSRKHQRAARLAALEEEINQLVYARFGLEPLGQTAAKSAPADPPLRDDLIGYLSYLVESALGYIPPGRKLREPDSPQHSVVAEPELLRRCEVLLLTETPLPGQREADLRWIGMVLGSRRGEGPEERLARFWREEWYGEHKRRFGGKPVFVRFHSGPGQAFVAYCRIRSLSGETAGELLTLAEQQWLRHVKLQPHLEQASPPSGAMGDQPDFNTGDAGQAAGEEAGGEGAAVRELREWIHRLKSWHPVPQSEPVECDRTRLARFASLFSNDD